MSIDIIFHTTELAEFLVTVTISTDYSFINLKDIPLSFISDIQTVITPLYDVPGPVQHIPINYYPSRNLDKVLNSNEFIYRSRLDNYALSVFLFLYKLWNYPYVKGMLAYFIYLLCIFFKNRIVTLFYFISFFIGKAEGALVRKDYISDLNVNLILMTLGNFFFIIFNLLFDYISAKVNLRDKIFINKLSTRILLSFSYFLNINSGVFGSNGTYFYLSDTKFKNVGLGLSILFSVLFSYFWFMLSTPTNIESRDILNSIFRSIAECIGFNSVAWLTYIAWEFWAITVSNPNYWGMFFFLPFMVFSILTISLEIRGFIAVRPWTVIYPIFYVLMFFSGAFFTNSLFYIYLNLNTKVYVTYILLGVSSITTSILYPDVYRSSNPRGNLWIKAFLYTTHYILLFSSFVFVTGILYNYI